jgi:hypothetical protein
MEDEERYWAGFNEVESLHKLHEQEQEQEQEQLRIADLRDRRGKRYGRGLFLKDPSSARPPSNEPESLGELAVCGYRTPELCELARSQRDCPKKNGTAIPRCRTYPTNPWGNVRDGDIRSIIGVMTTR